MESGLSMDALESELVGLAGHLAAGHCRWLRLLAEFDQRQGWAGPGMRSCAHWLCWRVGMSVRTGFEQLRVAHALTGLPAITTAFAAGRISYSKVRAITRVATDTNEAALLELALAGTASHVERAVRATRQAQADPEQTRSRRHLDWDWDDDGMLRLRGRLTAEQGARLVAALATLTDRPGSRQCPAEHSDTVGRCPAEHSGNAGRCPAEHSGNAGQCPAEQSQGGVADPEPLAARRTDALLELITGDGGDPELVVHLDVAAGTARLDHGSAVPRTVAERLGCAARVRALLRDRRGNPLYLGRTRRLVSPTQRAALTIRDHGECRFPGCHHRRHLDAHHIRPWWRGGRTDLDNLILLCGRHHQLIHDRGYRLHGPAAQVRFLRTDGQPIPPTGPPTSGDADTLLAQHAEWRLTITAETITPSWSGEPLDLTAVLYTLLPEPTMHAA